MYEASEINLKKEKEPKMELSSSEGAGRKKTPTRSGLGFLLRTYSLLLGNAKKHIIVLEMVIMNIIHMRSFYNDNHVVV